MFERFRRLLSGHRARSGFAGGPPAPARPLYAVGDVHGRDDLLARLLARIEAEDGAAGADLVFLGDYVDRGEHSAAVLSRLRARQAADPGRVVCLMGNHERMLLDFLDAPADCGPRWLANGGLQTLASYGIAAGSGAEGLAQAAAALAASLGKDGVGWLRRLPLIWESGNLACVHAAADPDQPLDEQAPETLLWGHSRFARQPRPDGIWVVHGHTVVETAGLADGRIAVDTGACFTGRLTAAALRPGEPVRFLCT